MNAFAFMIHVATAMRSKQILKILNICGDTILCDVSFDAKKLKVNLSLWQKKNSPQ